MTGDRRVHDRVQRRCGCSDATCTGCSTAQRRPRGPAPSRVPPAVYSVVRSAGKPLAEEVRRAHARSLQHDLRDVRIHEGADAQRAAIGLNADAFTFGTHIVLGGDVPRPTAPGGDAILAHELTHAVAQQAAWDPRRRALGELTVEPADHPHERAAARAEPGSTDGGDVATEPETAPASDRATEPAIEPAAEPTIEPATEPPPETEPPSRLPGAAP